MSVTMEHRSVGATLPWAQPGRSNHDKRERHASLHYRGWTLVDIGRARFARLDGTNVLRRICRQNLNEAEAIRLFRAKVDMEEG